jgi:predicted O-methyltransferase YrrM
MSRSSFLLPENLRGYVEEHWLREPDILRRLRQETAAMPQANMQISADQGQLMAMLVRLIGARRTLEIGVFTGYSSLATAMALPSDGKIVACDVSEEFTAVARRYWEEAGVSDKIDLRLAPALETLDALLACGSGGVFDFCFIDADKANYEGYFERALRLVRPGGLIAVDNVLWDGKVADAEARDPDTESIRAFNARLATDDRVELALLPIGDGLTLARVLGSAS